MSSNRGSSATARGAMNSSVICRRKIEVSLSLKHWIFFLIYVYYEKSSELQSPCSNRKKRKKETEYIKNYLTRLGLSSFSAGMVNIGISVDPANKCSTNRCAYLLCFSGSLEHLKVRLVVSFVFLNIHSTFNNTAPTSHPHRWASTIFFLFSLWNFLALGGCGAQTWS